MDFQLDCWREGVLDATHDNAVFASYDVVTWISAITGEQKRIASDIHIRAINVVFMEQGEDMRVVVISNDELIYIDPRLDTVVARKKFPIILSQNTRKNLLTMVKSSTGTAYLVTTNAKLNSSDPDRTSFAILEVTFDDIILRVFEDHPKLDPAVYYGNIKCIDIEANSMIVWFGCAVECEIFATDRRNTPKRHGQQFGRVLLSVDPESGCCAWRGQWNAEEIQECDHMVITPTISGENREIFDIGLRPVSTGNHVFVRGRLWFTTIGWGLNRVCFRDFDSSADTKPCVGF